MKDNHPGLEHVTKERIKLIRHVIATHGGDSDPFAVVPSLSDYRLAYQMGIRTAAEFVGMFDDQIDHEYRMQDVILAKFNLIKGKPRRAEASAIL